MIHLRAIAKKQHAKKIDFPFNLPLIKAFKEIQFHHPVTFFVGENGSGKSTMLSAIAAGVGSITVGGKDIQRDKTLNHAHELSTQLKFVWQKKKFPEATILSFDTNPPKEVAYDELEHVSLTKAFLNNPQSFLRHL